MNIVQNKTSPLVILTSGGEGGEGGGDVLLYCAAILGTACLGIMAHKSLPRVQMKFVKGTYGYSLMVRSTNYPSNIRISDNNISGLTFKGYILLQSNLPRNHDEYDYWRQAMFIETSKSFEEFQAECMKHDVHTTLSYKYSSLFLGREITKQKKFYWHKQKLDKLA